MSPLKIRRYETPDSEAVIELHRIALEQVGAYAHDRSVDQDLDQIEEVYLNNNGEFLIGECDGRLIAMGALRRTTAERSGNQAHAGSP